MKSIIATKYGPAEVLRIIDADIPEIDSAEVLVKVVYCAVTAADSRIRGGRFPKGFGLPAKLIFGIKKPRNPVLGSTFSGVVEKVGKSVSSIKVGDKVCGMTGIKMGTYSEYIAVKQEKCITVPEKVTLEDAVGVLFGGTAGLYFIRDKLQTAKGDKALINGASGAVGTNALQLAKYFGAEVTAVTSSDNTELMKDLGAAQVIDYQKQNVGELDSKYDVVLDAVGNITPSVAKKLLTSKGRAGLMVANLLQTITSRGAVRTGTATEKPQDIEFLLTLIANKQLQVVIQKIYDYTDIVEAHRHVDTGRKVGNILIKF